MATSTITAEFKIDNKKAANKICDALSSNTVKTNPSKSKEMTDISQLLRIIRR